MLDAGEGGPVVRISFVILITIGVCVQLNSAVGGYSPSLPGYEGMLGAPRSASHPPMPQGHKRRFTEESEEESALLGYQVGDAPLLTAGQAGLVGFPVHYQSEQTVFDVRPLSSPRPHVAVPFPLLFFTPPVPPVPPPASSQVPCDQLRASGSSSLVSRCSALGELLCQRDCVPGTVC